jgi:pectate lyase
MLKYAVVGGLLMCLSCVESVQPDTDYGIQEPSGLPAFTGAEGFGSHTMGGRGGKVLQVTNLEAEGPGSLRAALEASGPRIVVFTVSGTIDLKGRIDIYNPYVTIAGQTAPGAGITIRNGTISFRTHDFVVQGIRVRVGDELTGTPAGIRDGIEVNGTGAYNGIIDHCSIAWGVDENVGITQGAHDITVSWCIIAEGLSNSIHPKGEHSKGLMVNHSAGANHSLHHNLIAHNLDRNPQAVAPTNIEVINNVVYNFVFGGRFDNNAKVHFIGNTWIPGPNTQDGRMGIIVGESPGNTRAYVHDNFGPNRTMKTADEWAITDAPRIFQSGSYLFSPTGVTTDPAESALDMVIDGAGAFPRDQLDIDVIESVGGETGRIINSQSEVGGWPLVPSSTAPTDADSDGMPDYWEYARQLNPGDPNDASSDPDGDGYTNIEVYLNHMLLEKIRLKVSPATEQ